jgi:hypothetical protein
MDLRLARVHPEARERCQHSTPKENAMKRNKQAENAEAAGTVQPYSDVTAVMLQALETIDSVMPRSELTQGLHIDWVRRRLGVTREMIASAITASGASPRFQGIMDASEARDTLALYDALQPVFTRMNAINQDLRFTIEARLVKTSREALNLYAAAKRVAEDPDEVAVASHLQSMAAHMPKGRGRRKAPPEAPSATDSSTTGTGTQPPPSDPADDKQS